MSAVPVLAVEAVSKRFGPNTVLDGIDLELHAGEIRAICGENGAGKSTLVKIITGVHRADSGVVRIDGAPTEIASPQRAQQLGIALVAQELSLAPALSVDDNIWLGNREVPLLHRRQSLRQRSRAALDKVGLTDLSLDTPVSQLSIGRRQLVELARMLTRNARVLILDEPTATLSDVEIERIFAALRALKAEGRSIVFITHRLGEVFQLCDRVTVLRNGRLIGTRPTADLDRAELMEMMLGRSLGDMYPPSTAPADGQASGQPMLVVRNLSVPPIVRDFDLTAERGMVICLAGQVGSGAIEILRALAGLAHDASGEVVVAGRPMALRSVRAAQAARVQFISEDRAGEGVFLRLSVAANLVATRLGSFTRLGLLDRLGLRSTASRRAAAVAVDRKRLRSKADELSGGNQQKLAFGRSLDEDAATSGGDDAADAGVLLMNEPTRGVDVGARAEIYRLIRQFCDRGTCLVMASSDIEEVLGMADVIVCMYRGRMVATYRRRETDVQRVLADITGHPAPGGPDSSISAPADKLEMA